MATETMPRTGGTPRRVPGRGTPPSRTLPPRVTAPPVPAAPGRSRPARPVSAPRHTRPVTGPATGPATGPVTPPVAGRKPHPRSPRTPFILLLVGLLGGALVSLLVISTTLAQGAFQITSLQQQNNSLARQEQTLTNEVAQAGNPAVIAAEAAQYGMQQDPNLRFVNLKTGKIVSGKVSKSDAAIDVPGYNP
jgi:hypothetical protein